MNNETVGEPGAPRTRLVLLAHGSTSAAWRRPFEELVLQLQRDPGERQVVLAYLEHCEPSITEIADDAARDRIAELRILPLFLATGTHLAEDLPCLVDQIERDHPSLRVRTFPAIGDDPRLRGLIVQMAREMLGDGLGA